MTVEYYPVGAYQANCVFWSDGNGHLAVIDPGDEAERLLARLRERGEQVAAILLTHAHFDHLLAVRELQAATGAPLYLHVLDAPALTRPELSLLPAARRPYALTADRLLHEGDTVAVGALSLTVLHTPGHTPGSCCYSAEGVLAAGDTLFAGSRGRTDFPGGDDADMRNSLRRLAALPDAVRVIAGHGEETTVGWERTHNPYMASVLL